VHLKIKPQLERFETKLEPLTERVEGCGLGEQGIGLLKQPAPQFWTFCQNFNAASEKSRLAKY